MNGKWQATERRLLELLADRAAFGLDRGEVEELRQLLQTMPDFDTECMERAAATVQLAQASIRTLTGAAYSGVQRVAIYINRIGRVFAVVRRPLRDEAPIHRQRSAVLIQPLAVLQNQDVAGLDRQPYFLERLV